MDEQDDIQRWTAKRRTALVLNIIRRETSAQEAARKHGLTVAEVEFWLERAMAAIRVELTARSGLRVAAGYKASKSRSVRSEVEARQHRSSA